MRLPESRLETLAAGVLLGVPSAAISLWVPQVATAALTGQVQDLSSFAAVSGNIAVLLWLAISRVVGGFLKSLAFCGYLVYQSLDLSGGSWLCVAMAVLLNASCGATHAYHGLGRI